MAPVTSPVASAFVRLCRTGSQRWKTRPAHTPHSEGQGNWRASNVSERKRRLAGIEREVETYVRWTRQLVETRQIEREATKM